jgi:Cu(I)/Ag(I) efflux system membrane fusion protein
MKAINYSLILFLFVLVSCTYKVSKDEDGNGEEENSATQTAPKFQHPDTSLGAQLNQVVQQYIDLKNALVRSDSKEAAAKADGIISALSKADSTKLSAEQKTDYLSAVSKISSGAKSISGSADIEKQRESFNLVTEGIYSLVRSFSLGKPFFYEYCPMANNDKGGYWISETEEVNNPYFGDEMLHCGEVKETIK